MKNTNIYLVVCSLVVYMCASYRLVAQSHAPTYGIVPVHRVLSGDLTYDSLAQHREENLHVDVSLWYLPWGGGQILGPGSETEDMQGLQIDLAWKGLTTELIIHSVPFEARSLEARMGYKFSPVYQLTLHGGIATQWGYDEWIHPYPFNSHSSYYEAFIQGKWKQYGVYGVLSYEVGWYEQTQLVITNPLAFYHHEEIYQGMMHVYGIG